MRSTKGKRLICLVLSLVLVLTSCVTALADSGKMVYAALGDSIAAGYGLDSYYEAAGGQHKNADGKEIPGSYAYLTGEGLDAEVRYCGHSGWRIAEMRYMLNYKEGNVFVNEDDDFFLSALGLVQVKDKWVSKTSAYIQKAVVDADLITLQIGQNDIFSTAIYATYKYVADEKNGFIIPDTDDIDGITGVLDVINTVAQQSGRLGEIVAEFEKNLDRSCETFKEELPKLIADIHSMNEDAEIVILGMNNPLSTQLTQYFVDLADFRVAKVNNYLKNQCPCRNEYVYCDISGTVNYGVKVLETECLFSEKPSDIVYSAVRMIHPTEKGHEYIAGQILNAVKNNMVRPVIQAKYTKLGLPQLNWDRVDGAVAYKIYRSTGSDCRCIGISLNTLFFDLTAPRGTSCAYTVRAVMDLHGSLSAPSVTQSPVKR